MTTEDKTRGLTTDAGPAPGEPQGLPDGTERIKVLVVEDDRTTRLLYDKGLFDPIFDKKMVASGKEALHVYDEWHPEIVILDIYLPEMTGYQVLKTIRSTVKDKQTTIVMATSLSGSEDVLSCMKLGIEGYIVKPFAVPDIGLKILDYYEKKEPERARKAAALCRRILLQSQMGWLLDKNPPQPQDLTEDSKDGAPGKETENSGEEREKKP
ncbi:MAG: response regulator [Deltaproteobacteria bacterium]|nr:response regulator [Deltaproteobacteria bacterium]